MIAIDQLNIGEPYYHMLFKDKNMSIPIIETFFYVGCNIFDTGDSNVEEFYFQDSSSFIEQGKIISINEDGGHNYLVLSEDLFTCIYTKDGLLEELGRHNN